MQDGPAVNRHRLDWRRIPKPIIVLLVLLGVANFISHAIDGLVWTFEPSPLVLSGIGNKQGPETLLAAGPYSFSLDVTGAQAPATSVENGQTVATCLVELSLHSQPGDVVFLPVPESVHLTNNISMSETLLYFTVVQGTGLYDFYIVADPGCEWRLTVDRV
jgi:hypothetical protein